MKIDPEEVIYSITMRDIARAVERRIGKEKANNLSDADQALLKEELLAVSQHMGNDLLGVCRAFCFKNVIIA